MRSYSTKTSAGTEEPQSEEERALVRLEKYAEGMESFEMPRAAAADHQPEAPLLIVCYAIIHEITSYLARHGDDGAPAYLSVFMNSEAPEDSDLDRARRSVGALTKKIVALFKSVSSSSPLRAEHSAIFALSAALENLCISCDALDLGWRDFWSRAQPMVLELGAKLQEAGFGPE
ncbi:hypothetical protein C8R44DRAFT_734980 [Mycena epipterygia]|nr:hypothetical protein C8R44DRAFT_734980 [Mycena epipterygia]